MNIGDKVRFLNTTGGGIVKGFQGKDIVIVEDDGFDTPVLIKECVIIEPANEAQVRQSVKPKTTNLGIDTQPYPKIEELEVLETKEGERLTVCLAYLPVDIKTLTTTDYECYLINDSNYYLSYSYMSRVSKGWISRQIGYVEPNTKIFLEEFSKADLNGLEKICVQFIAYKPSKPFDLKKPCSAEVRIDTVKFYKLHSFKENDYFEDNAIIYTLMKHDLVEKELFVDSKEIEGAMTQKTKAQRPRIQKIDKKQKDTPIEIDLHIDELIDTTAGLSPADILDYQLSKFREVMDEYQTQKGQKIVFIHGKGNGVLKDAISKELRIKYKNVYSQDASFREYGFGATMITIK